MPRSILLATGFRPQFSADLSEFATVLPDPTKLSAAEASAVRVLVTIGVFKTGGAMMDLYPNLGLICCYGTGYEGVDLEAARARGIMVTHSPAVNASAVADQAMALLLACARDITLGDAFVRTGKWSRAADAPRMPVKPGLTGRKLGIFGLGEIGRRVAARGTAFEMEIAYHGRSPRADAPWRYFDSLVELASWADALIVATRADANNRHAVNETVLRALGPKGTVVNIARGSLIDEDALIRLLDSGELGGAGLDVYEHEPSVPEGLRNSSRAVLAPHLGGATDDAQDGMHALVLANIRAFLAGKPVINPVPEFAN